MNELEITKDYEKKEGEKETLLDYLFLCPVLGLDSEILTHLPRLIPELSELKADVITTEENSRGWVVSLGPYRGFMCDFGQYSISVSPFPQMQNGKFGLDNP